MQADFELIYYYAKTKNADALNNLLSKNYNCIDPRGIDENGRYWSSPICKLAAEQDQNSVKFLSSFYPKNTDLTSEADIWIGRGFVETTDQLCAIISNLKKGDQPDFVMLNLLKGLVMANRLDDLQTLLWDPALSKKTLLFYSTHQLKVVSSELGLHLGYHRNNHDALKRLTLLINTRFLVNPELQRHVETDLHEAFNDGLLLAGHLSGHSNRCDPVGTDRRVALLAHNGHYTQIEDYWFNHPSRISPRQLKKSWYGITERNFLYFAAQTRDPVFRKMLCTYFANYGYKLSITNQVGTQPKRITALAMGLHRAMQAGKTYDEALALFGISAIACTLTQETAENLQLFHKSTAYADHKKEQEMIEFTTTAPNDLATYVKFYTSFSELTASLDAFKLNYKKKQHAQAQLNPAITELSERVDIQIQHITDQLLLNKEVKPSDINQLDNIKKALTLLSHFSTPKQPNQVTDVDSPNEQKSSTEALTELEQIATKLADAGDLTGYKTLGVCLMSLGVLLTPLVVGVPLFKVGYGFFKDGQSLGTTLEDTIDEIKATMTPKPSH